MSTNEEYKFIWISCTIYSVQKFSVAHLVIFNDKLRTWSSGSEERKLAPSPWHAWERDSCRVNT